VTFEKDGHQYHVRIGHKGLVERVGDGVIVVRFDDVPMSFYCDPWIDVSKYWNRFDIINSM
jgi:hypothetical protein